MKAACIIKSTANHSRRGSTCVHAGLVPASKSDIFRDRSLSLGEKRLLMTFITTAVEAAQGRGRLKVGRVGMTGRVGILGAQQALGSEDGECLN